MWVVFFTPVYTNYQSQYYKVFHAHCSIVGCNNKQANNSVTLIYINFPKDAYRRKSWLAAISRDKDNLPSIFHVFVCSDHFEDKYFDNSWDLQNRLFCTDRLIKRKLISTAILILLPQK